MHALGQLKEVTGAWGNESAQQSLVTHTNQCTLTRNEFAMQRLVYICTGLKTVLNMLC